MFWPSASKLAQTWLACTFCADACLAEDAVVELRTTMRLAQDTADTCTTTARFLSWLTEMDGNLLKTILMLCRDFATTFALAAEACRRLGPRPF